MEFRIPNDDNDKGDEMRNRVITCVLHIKGDWEPKIESSQEDVYEANNRICYSRYLPIMQMPFKL
jgi:hypothetical protein